MTQEYDLDYLTICSVREDCSNEELSRIITHIRDIDQPQHLKNKDIFIEPDDVDDYEVLYSNDTPEVPNMPGFRTVIESDILDDDTFHIHSFIESIFKEETLEYHTRMLQPLEQIEVAFISSHFTGNISSENIISNMYSDPEKNTPDIVSGIEFNLDGFEFQLKSEESGSSISAVTTEALKIPPNSLSDEVDSHIESSRDKLQEMVE